jgi:hypothetical protein
MPTALTRRSNGALASPVRNRYFYGKLLDADHLDLEQRYFLERGRLVNRLTLGSGVLCGLGVAARDGGLVVSPGVAVDGLGREIVVTDPVVLDDPLALTDECGRPTGERRDEGPTVVCLAYHECDVDPAPVLVSDCDIREECVPGAVQERFRLLVHDPDDVDLPEDPCSILRPKLPGGGLGSHLRPELRPTGMKAKASEESAAETTETVSEEIARAYARAEAGVAVRDRPLGLREQLCALIHPPCGPGARCVPIALVTTSGDELVVDPCGVRRTIYSNAVLLDLILCLAERMESCCDRRVSVSAPVVTAMAPAPGAAAKPSELDDVVPKKGGIALSFDRELRADRLAAPAEWLRVMLLVERGDKPEDGKSVGPSGGGAVGRAIPLELDRTEPTALGGGDGFTAYYAFTFEGGLEALVDTIKRLDVNRARFLVVARSDDVTQIADTSDPAELLDADYKGTGLDPSVLDLLWDLGPLAAALPAALLGSVELPGGAAPPSLPSGNNIEGGVFHAYFDLAL